MILYPDIAIKDGKCVTLRKGQMTLPVIYDHDPIEKARDFVEQGAEWLNVVDLDAMRRGRSDNSELIVELISRVDVPVQVSGGINKIEHVHWWMDQGADCVVITAAAYLAPGLVEKACRAYPYRILVGVDIRDGKVMIEGWTRPTDTRPLEFSRRFEHLELGGIIVTDLNYDADHPEVSFALVADLSDNLKTPVIASGLIKSLDDLASMQSFETIAGAIVGRPLHQGDIPLQEALRLVWGVDPAEAWWRKTDNLGELPEEEENEDAFGKPGWVLQA